MTSYLAGRRTRQIDVVLEVALSEISVDDTRFQFRIGGPTSDIRKSIECVGQQVPVTLWGRNSFLIIDGFRRVQALAALGRNSVRAIVRDDLDERGAFHLSHCWVTVSTGPL
jgi:hypothetical protein